MNLKKLILAPKAVEKPEATTTVAFGVPVIFEKPPVFDALCMAFEVTPHTLFAYDGKIYNPFKLPLSEDVVEHEKIHLIQQEETGGAAIWYGRYLRENSFRMEQELEAYRVQYNFIKTKVRDREQLHRILSSIAGTLSGPLYGECIDYTAAYQMIKN